MGFLAPSLLLLGLAAAVPLVLHLLQRHQARTVVFPALRYLRRAERESARRIRLRQILLLALRIAAVLLLALAAARPLVPGGAGAHPPTTLAIILDNSLSSGAVVGDRRVLDDLRSRALQTVAAAGPGDRFWLLRASQPWQPATAAGREETARRIRATEPTAGAADLGEAVRRARAILEAAGAADGGRGAGPAPAEIQLLSDLQASGLPAAVAGQKAGPPLLIWAPEGASPPNRGIGPLDVGGGLPPRAGERSTIAVPVLGASTPADSGPVGRPGAPGRASAPADTLSLRLRLDGSVRAAAMGTVGSTAVLPFPAHAPGWVTGSVEMDADALREDDRRYFAVRVVPPPRVAVVGPGPFLEEALGVLDGSGRIERSDAGDAALVFSPAGEGAGRLAAGADAVVYPAADPVELPALNRRLASAAIPWRLAAPRGRGDVVVQPPPEDPELGSVLRPLRLPAVYGLVRTGGALGEDSVLLRTVNGTPLVVRGRAPGGGRWVLLAVPLESEAIAASPAFLPLLDRLTGAWLEEVDRARVLAPGTDLTLPEASDALAGPGGRSVAGGGTTVRLEAPGIYRALAGERTLEAFVVNPPSEESDLTRASVATLRARFPGWDLRVVPGARAWGRAIFGGRHQREVSWPLLLTAIILLLVEMAVAAAGRPGARTAPGPTPGSGTRNAVGGQQQPGGGPAPAGTGPDGARS